MVPTATATTSPNLHAAVKALGALPLGRPVAFLLAFIILVAASPAWALPSFARQTGMECASCHVAFPELTTTGRLFKLKGYTMQGGSSDLLHIAVMLQPAFTHTQGAQAGGAAPDFGPNDNFALEQASIFYGGAISTELGIGTFAQATYSETSKHFSWDNTDVRFARVINFEDGDLIYGLSVNNNPTVQDVWNTTPAWRFPFASPSLSPAPITSTLIEGIAQQVVGFGGYVDWDNFVYGEVSGYRTLGAHTLSLLGIEPSGTSSFQGIAPYWRLALQPNWGKNSLEFGTFGLASRLFPQRVATNGTDGVLDLGIDTQYQFVGDRDQISFQGSFIHQSSDLAASSALGFSSKHHDSLGSANAKVSYFYDHTYGINLSYFNVSGTTDTGLFAPSPITGSASGSPDTSGFVIEADYVPFMHGGPEWWPWLNVRFALQYTIYDKFNGGHTNYDGFGRKASDNNTLFLLAWLAF